MNPVNTAVPTTASAPVLPDRLRQTASRLEGVFVNQLFQAMRETVPQDGSLSGGTGEETFTSLFDQELADRAPDQWHHGLGTAIVRALSPRAATTTSVVARPTAMPAAPRTVMPERR